MKAPLGQLLIILLAIVSTHFAFAQEITETVTYFHHDAQGSIIASSDENGDLLWRKVYQPYGKQIAGSDTTEEISYTGKEYDADTGLMYFGARYYDPAIGRFMGIDPAPVSPNNPHSFNRYVYANNNPYRYVDPDGRCAVELSGSEILCGIADSIANALEPIIESAMLEAGIEVVPEGQRDPDGDFSHVAENNTPVDEIIGVGAAIVTEANPAEKLIKQSNRARKKGDRMTSKDDAEKQFRGIEKEQNKRRKKGDNVSIESIKKSKQRANNALKPHNIDLDNLDD